MPEKPRKPPLAIVTSPATTRLEPPRKLGEAGLSLWHSIQAEFAISDSGGAELLVQACQLSDRLATMAARIEADGVVIWGKTGPREHPLLKAEIQTRALLVRTLQRLGVTDELVRPLGRPPRSIGWEPD
jgi:hypothetical protein